jgi:hypothetical protein
VAALLAPYAALGIFAMFLGDPAATILALAPSTLVGPRVARLVGVREESTAALMTASIVISFPLLLAVAPAARSLVDMGLFAFVVGAAIAGAIPTVRDAMLPVLDGARYVAIAIAIVVAFIASAEIADPHAYFIAASCLVIGPLSAAGAARLLGGDPLAAAIGSGTRDPAVAAGLAVGTGLVGGGAVAFAYAVLLALAVGVGKLLVGGQPRREAARQ